MCVASPALDCLSLIDVLQAELAEATAQVMLRDDFNNTIILLTGPRAVTLTQVVQAINQATGRDIKVERIEPGRYVDFNAENDEGGKARWFFEKRVSCKSAPIRGLVASVQS